MSVALLVPTHPEVVPGDPALLCWRVPDGVVRQGVLRSAPGALGELLTAGVLVEGLVSHRAVWLRLRPGRSWRAEGTTVRDALQRALADPAAWVVEPAPDLVLSRVAEQALAGRAGDLVRSHGGTVALVDVRDGVVTVAMGGACAHCPLLHRTLSGTLEPSLRPDHPDLVAVRTHLR